MLYGNLIVSVHPKFVYLECLAEFNSIFTVFKFTFKIEFFVTVNFLSSIFVIYFRNVIQKWICKWSNHTLLAEPTVKYLELKKGSKVELPILCPACRQWLKHNSNSDVLSTRRQWVHIPDSFHLLSFHLHFISMNQVINQVSQGGASLLLVVRKF